LGQFGATSTSVSLMRRYRYVGPEELLSLVTSSRGGALDARCSGTFTFVVTTDGIVRVAPRHSEHVACAAGEDVLSAGEMRVERGRVVSISNQSTGYCPEPESWPVVAAALERAGVRHPGAFTDVIVFRRCTSCSQRNIVKDADFTCAVCGAPLADEWNFE
jgi:hypothetical protein